MTELVSQIGLRLMEAEQRFAGMAFRYPGRATHLCGFIAPDTFRDERIRRFWKDLLGGVDPVDAATAAGVLGELLRWSDGDEFILSSDPRVYANDLIQERVFLANAGRLTELVSSIERHDFEGMRRVTSEMASVMPETIESVPNAIDIGLEFVNSLDDDTVTIPTFIPKLDHAIGGLWRQSTIVVCARPSVGKSALAWQIARNVAASGNKALFISLEMSRRALWARAACGSLRIPYRDVLAHRITQEQRESIIEKNAELMAQYEDRLFVDDRTGQDTMEVWRKVANLRPDVLIVDHIRLLADRTNEREVKRLGMITWNLKQIAKEFDCAVVPLAQLNRGLESREDKRPILADLRDSGEIEENADFVLGMHRDRQYLEKAMERTPAEIVVLKFRDGPSDILLKMEFDGLGQWFNDGK